MKTELRGGKLIIEIDLVQPPRPSASGKTLILASSGGFVASEAQFEGQPISVSVNATVRKA